MTNVPKLITFAPMIDSETWRLLLQHYGVAFEEEPHAFIWGSVLALVQAGSPQVPALCGARLRMVDPAAAIARWDAQQPPGRALIPPDPAMSACARRDWDTFHGTLATATARLAYFHLLPHRRIMIEPFTRGTPARERAVTRAAYPVQRAVLSLLLRLSARTAADALVQIRAVLDETDARLADGRPFLQGERMTAGDVALAAAMAPVTLPAGSRSPVPQLADMPAPYAAIVAEMRARPTGSLVKRFYSHQG